MLIEVSLAIVAAVLVVMTCWLVSVERRVHRVRQPVAGTPDLAGRPSSGAGSRDELERRIARLQESLQSLDDRWSRLSERVLQSTGEMTRELEALRVQAGATDPGHAAVLDELRALSDQWRSTESQRSASSAAPVASTGDVREVVEAIPRQLQAVLEGHLQSFRTEIEQSARRTVDDLEAALSDLLERHGMAADVRRKSSAAIAWIALEPDADYTDSLDSATRVRLGLGALGHILAPVLGGWSSERVEGFLGELRRRLGSRTPYTVFWPRRGEPVDPSRHKDYAEPSPRRGTVVRVLCWGIEHGEDVIWRAAIEGEYE